MIAALLLTFMLAPAASASEIFALHTDHAGSVIMETDKDRNITWQGQYEPYGLPTQSTPKGPGYTGHVHDSTSGLVYMQQRYYDPQVGRFLSADPMAVNNATAWNFNRYNYAANNPYLYKDPDGEAIDTFIDIGFVLYDTGQFLGATAAAVHGYAVGNQSLQSIALEGMSETSVDMAISAGSMAVPGLSAPVAKAAIKNSDSISDSAVVVRGGISEVPPPGEVFSGAAGNTLNQAAAGVPHGQIRATTAGAIRASGGKVEHAPEMSRSGVVNERHVNVCQGSGPCAFGPVQPNPVNKADRIK